VVEAAAEDAEYECDEGVMALDLGDKSNWLG
jgi:hypothetical protein